MDFQGNSTGTGSGKSAMNSFNKKLLQRISLICCILAAVFGLITQRITVKIFEHGSVHTALHTAEPLYQLVLPEYIDQPGHLSKIQTALKNITQFAVFDNAEMYDPYWNKLGEASDPQVTLLHNQLRFKYPHPRSALHEPFYESIYLPDGRHAVNVFVPLHLNPDDKNSLLLGYFEGLRITPKWRQDQIDLIAYAAALFVFLGTIIVGAILYPTVSSLNLLKDKRTQEAIDSHISLMKSLGEAVARRDSETGAHNYRVTLIASAIAESMHLKPHEMRSLIVGSLLHDVGKIGISDSILLKKGSLTSEEMDIMQTHVHHGEQIVQYDEWIREARDVISSHHERWDGTGYPRQLQKDQIPLNARIFAIADVFDALCSARPYKRPFEYDEAISIMKDGSGSHFDPAILARFLELSESFGARIISASEEYLQAQFQILINNYFKAENE